jgi:hypothetical protein
MHPVSPHVGEFCHIDVLHVHRVSPPDMRVYVHQKTGEYLFVGDPVAQGYDGPKFGYFGPHLVHDPVAGDAQRIFCYLAGAHYHAYQPPASPTYTLKDGVYWYLGEAPPHDRERSWINEVNPARAGYAAPKVDLSMAPPGYRPFQVVEPPPPPPVAPVLPTKGAQKKAPASAPAAAGRTPARVAPQAPAPAAVPGGTP